MSSEKLQNITTTCMENVRSRLQSSFSKSDVLNTGSWSNDLGVIVSYLSYYKDGDTTGNSIDAIATINMHNNIELSIDICRSDGEILVEVMQANIELGEGVAKIVELCNAAEDRIVAYFENLISTD